MTTGAFMTSSPGTLNGANVQNSIPDRTFYDRTLLERALPELLHDKFGQRKNVPQRSGDKPKFRRYESLPVAKVELNEDIIPSSMVPTYTDVEGTIRYFGSWIKVTDRIQMVSQDPVITEFTALNGEQMGESLDEIYRDRLHSGTSVFYANGVAGRANIIAKLSKADLQKIGRSMETNKAKKFTEIIAGTDRFNTTPINAAFYVICDEYAALDLENILGADFIPKAKYPDPSKAMEQEIGAFGKFRFCQTTKAKQNLDSGGTAVTNTLKYTTADTACDVHTMLIFGKNAYGVCNLDGGVEVIVEPREGGGPMNPLHQFGTVGWKAAIELLILNNLFMTRYEFGVSR